MFRRVIEHFTKSKNPNSRRYKWDMALVATGIIGVVTFGFCVVGVCISKKAGSCFSGKAGIVGGAILIIIGLEIFITSWF